MASNFPLLQMELAQEACNRLGYDGYRQQTDEIRAEVHQEMKQQAADRAEHAAQQEAHLREHPECMEMSAEEEADWVKEYGPVQSPERASDGGTERGGDER